MKLAYERPMMRAEEYKANSYFSICAGGSPTFLGKMLSLANATFHTISWNFGSLFGGDLWSYSGPQNVSDTLKGLDFNGSEAHPFDGEANGNKGQQYFWTDTADGSTYHLEYSIEHSKLLGDSEDPVFVLYGERNNENGLQVNWDGFTGTGSDNDSDFDDALYAVRVPDFVVVDS